MNEYSGYYSQENCDLDEFKTLVSQTVDMAEIPQATAAPKNIPIYEMNDLRGKLDDPDKRRSLMAEWARILNNGAGVFVLKHAYQDTAAIDLATQIFDQIIAREKASDGQAADHFATAGANDRIWNSLQKLCEQAPETYIQYFANPVLDTACEAWLGPNYQMTAQVNLVHPGGKAQQAHRDYHLGFQSADVSATYPAHVHDLSPLMTLQGGIAHCDMPIEAGPTKLLPFSQAYREGYAAWRRDDFRAHFEENYVQLPLEKGDAIFFNPALFHGAGENVTTDIHRMVNLLQISSPFGRSLENINRAGMCKKLFKPLAKAWRSESLTRAELDAVIASCAEGYSFPTNLDLDPPIGGLAPVTMQAILREAILNGKSKQEFKDQINELVNRRKA